MSWVGFIGVYFGYEGLEGAGFGFDGFGAYGFLGLAGAGVLIGPFTPGFAGTLLFCFSFVIFDYPVS